VGARGPKPGWAWWLLPALILGGTLVQAVVADPVATRSLVARLKASGRAEVRVSVSSPGSDDPPSRGSLILEPPDRVRLDFPATGERIALRVDGGEWLQPAARQIVVLKAGHLEAVRGLWGLFLHPEEARFDERRGAPRRFVLTRRADEAELPDSVTILLGSDGLPRRLEVAVGEDRQVYELSGWRFLAPRGAASFKLRAPPGFAVVEMP